MTQNDGLMWASHTEVRCGQSLQSAVCSCRSYPASSPSPLFVQSILENVLGLLLFFFSLLCLLVQSNSTFDCTFLRPPWFVTLLHIDRFRDTFYLCLPFINLLSDSGSFSGLSEYCLGIPLALCALNIRT